MLAGRSESGARRHESTLVQEFLGDLVLRRAWAGKGNHRGAGKSRCSWMSRLLREVEKVCARRRSHGYDLARADDS